MGWGYEQVSGVVSSLGPRPFFLQLNAGSKKGPGTYCMGDSVHASNLTSYFS